MKKINNYIVLALMAVLFLFLSSCASTEKPKPKEGIHGFGYIQAHRGVRA